MSPYAYKPPLPLIVATFRLFSIHRPIPYPTYTPDMTNIGKSVKDIASSFDL